MSCSSKSFSCERWFSKAACRTRDDRIQLWAAAACKLPSQSKVEIMPPIIRHITIEISVCFSGHVLSQQQISRITGMSQSKSCTMFVRPGFAWRRSHQMKTLPFLVSLGEMFPTDHGAVIAVELLHVIGILSPCFASVEHNRVNAGCEHLIAQLRCEAPGGGDRQEFPERSSGHATSGCNSTFTAATGAQDVAQLADNGLNIAHSAVIIHFSHCSVVNDWALLLYT